MRFATAVLALLLSVSPALAANWDVDRAKSKLGFSVAWGGQPFTGTITRWKARIAFDRSRLDQAMVDVSVDLSSLTSGDGETDDSVKGAYGFEVAKYPIARFLATKFTRKDDGSYVADGTLTIKGVSKPVSLPFSLDIRRDTGPRGGPRRGLAHGFQRRHRRMGQAHAGFLSGDGQCGPDGDVERALGSRA